MALTALLAAAAAVAALLSWARAARARRLFGRRVSIGMAGWAALTAVAELAAVRSGALGWPSVALLAAAALPGGYGVAGIVRSATVSGRLSTLACEAWLTASSALALGWVAALAAGHFAPEQVTGPDAVALVLGVLCLTACLLLLRLRAAVGWPTGSAPPVVVDPRYRPVLATAALAAALIAVPHPIAAALGAAVAAAVPWLSTSSAPVRSRPRRIGEVVPVVALAALAVVVGARGASGRSPGVPLVLGVLVLGGLVALLAVTLRENAVLRRDMEASGGRMTALLENTSDVILRVDLAGRVVSANAASRRLLGAEPLALAGRPLAELADAADRERLSAAVAAVAEGRRPASRIEVRLAPPAAGTAELRLTGVAGGAVGNLHDVTDAVRLRARLERLARYDQMTGLANRTHMLDVVGDWLGLPEPVTLLYGDLDGFKAVNDRFGHVAGDAVLTEVAKRLARAVRSMPPEVSLASRIGGDEFVLALRGVSLHDATALAEHAAIAMAASFEVGDRTVGLGMSVGVATSADGVPCRPGLAGASELLHRADLAMFAAKEFGRGHVRLWEPLLQERAQRRVDIAIGLRQALDLRRLALAYQPMVRLGDGVVVAVEALVRVPADDGAPGALGGLPSIVSPAELVEVAEDIGAIAELGQWVLAEATQQAAQWLAQGHDVLVSVNMSVRQLVAEGFPATVSRALAAAALPADRLVLEITESQLMMEAGPAVPALEALRDQGVTIAIDDFGTGYSSLAYLRHLPVRIVKIDKRLLDGVGVDPRATTLVRAVMGTARALGLLVVTEGLEDLATARIVRDLGAYAGQGFALSPAIGVEEMSRMLDRPALDLNAVGGSSPGQRAAAAGRGQAGLLNGQVVSAVETARAAIDTS